MAKTETVYPVYMIAGFLDSGKTSFINGILSDGFALEDRTLLLCCEEGEVEYDPKVLHNVTVVKVEDQETLTPKFLLEQQKKCKATQIIVEYNGMWNIQPFYAVSYTHLGRLLIKDHIGGGAALGRHSPGDLVRHGDGGPPGGIPQAQIQVPAAHYRGDGQQILDVYLHGAGGADGLPGKGIAGHCSDKADEVIVPFLSDDGGRQGTALAGAHRVAVVVPAVGEGVLPCHILCSQGEAYAFQRYCRVAVAESGGKRDIGGQSDRCV